MNDQQAWFDRADKRIAASTSQTSTLVRTLGLAAIGMAWAFAGGFGGGPVQNQRVIEALRGEHDLERALLLAIVALVLDAFQYAWSSICNAVQFWYSRAVFSPVPHENKESLRTRAAIRIAQLRGLFDAVENYTGLDSSLGYEARCKALRDLMVSLPTRAEWPEESPEWNALAYLAQDLRAPLHLANLAYGGKILAVAGAYVYILHFLT